VPKYFTAAGPTSSLDRLIAATVGLGDEDTEEVAALSAISRDK
jgi:hypothetical protein